jgi:Na+-transporting NADH:ubiquinone oxidoreductase subunit NqrB
MYGILQDPKTMLQNINQLTLTGVKVIEELDKILQGKWYQKLPKDIQPALADCLFTFLVFVFVFRGLKATTDSRTLAAFWEMRNHLKLFCCCLIRKLRSSGNFRELAMMEEILRQEVSPLAVKIHVRPRTYGKLVYLPKILDDLTNQHYIAA